MIKLMSAVAVVTVATAAVAVMTSTAQALELFVTNEKGNSVTIVDGTTLEVLASVPVGNRPRGIVISPDGKYVYICASDDDEIQIFDTASRKVVGTLPSGPDPEQLAISVDGKLLYVANEDDNMVTVIDTDSRQALSEIPVGVEPEGMGDKPRRQVGGRHQRDHQHGPLHRHRDPEIIGNVLVDQRPRYARRHRRRPRRSGSPPRSAARSA